MQKRLHSAIIVDDELSSRKYLRNLLANYSYITIASEAASVQEGIAAIQKHCPDIVFLDVEMPNNSGFDLIHDIHKQGLQTTIIFVTGYQKYAIEAIKHAAFDYLLKPVDPDELEKTLIRYHQDKIQPQLVHKKIELLFQALNNPKKISFNVHSGTIFIDPGNILYCRAEGNYTSLFMADNHEEMITCQIGILFDRLPADIFIRIGRSLIINHKRIERINRSKNHVVLENNGSVIELKLSSRLIHEISRLLLR